MDLETLWNSELPGGSCKPPRLRAAPSAARPRSVAALLSLALVGPALAQDGDGPSGAKAYATLCASCHREPARLGGRAEGLEDAARRAVLDRYLARHHASDAGQRAAIVDYLAGIKAR